MSKYRKKPVIIEAEQWYPPHDPRHQEIDGVCTDVSYTKGVEVVLQHYVQTLEGQMTVSPGDWIITGVKGEKYPCKPDIFEMSYEKVE